MKFRFPRFSPTPLSRIIKHASTDAIDLIAALCRWDPRKRPTAVECLQHPYFQTGIRPSPSLRPASYKTSKGSSSGQSSIGLAPQVVSYGHVSQPRRQEAPIQKQASLKKEPQYGRRASRELEPLIGRKISLRSQNSEESVMLPPIQKRTSIGANRAAFKLVPLNYQKVPSALQRRSSRNNPLQINPHQFHV